MTYDFDIWSQYIMVAWSIFQYEPRCEDSTLTITLLDYLLYKPIKCPMYVYIVLIGLVT